MKTRGDNNLEIRYAVNKNIPIFLSCTPIYLLSNLLVVGLVYTLGVVYTGEHH